MKLSEGETDEVLGRLSFKRRLAGKDLIVAIARCWTTGEVLMQAYMNREAASLTLTTGMVTYWSTSRDELWVATAVAAVWAFSSSWTVGAPFRLPRRRKIDQLAVRGGSREANCSA